MMCTFFNQMFWGLIRPDAMVKEENRVLLASTFLRNPDDDDEYMEGPPLPLQRRIEAAEYLLTVDNGSWKTDSITHRCRLGCCRSSKESKLKLWVALQDG